LLGGRLALLEDDFLRDELLGVCLVLLRTELLGGRSALLEDEFLRDE